MYGLSAAIALSQYRFPSQKQAMSPRGSLLLAVVGAHPEIAKQRTMGPDPIRLCLLKYARGIDMDLQVGEAVLILCPPFRCAGG
jgi:hypothetical protein